MVFSGPLVIVVINVSRFGFYGEKVELFCTNSVLLLICAVKASELFTLF